MLSLIKQFFINASETGLKLPFAFDPVRKAPSVTLFFVYIMFILMVGSLLALHFEVSLITASLTTVSVFFGCLVFYLIRTLSRVKFDLDDKSLELSDNTTTQSKEDSK